MSSQKETEILNKKLFAEKMNALKESNGNLGELVKRTPGASAKIIRKNGEEILLSKGPGKMNEESPHRGYREYR